MSATSVCEYLLFLLNGDVLGMLFWAPQFDWLMNGNSERHFAMYPFIDVYRWFSLICSYNAA